MVSSFWPNCYIPRLTASRKFAKWGEEMVWGLRGCALVEFHQNFWEGVTRHYRPMTRIGNSILAHFPIQGFQKWASLIQGLIAGLKFETRLYVYMWLDYGHKGEGTGGTQQGSMVLARAAHCTELRFWLNTGLDNSRLTTNYMVFARDAMLARYMPSCVWVCVCVCVSVALRFVSKRLNVGSYK